VQLSVAPGFFMDDTSHSGELTAPILRATQHIHDLGYTAVHNPGVASNDATLADTANITVQCEDVAARQVNFPSAQRAKKSAMILHHVDDFQPHFLTARAAGFQYFYATQTEVGQGAHPIWPRCWDLCWRLE